MRFGGGRGLVVRGRKLVGEVEGGLDTNDDDRVGGGVVVSNKCNGGIEECTDKRMQIFLFNDVLVTGVKATDSSRLVDQTLLPVTKIDVSSPQAGHITISTRRSHQTLQFTDEATCTSFYRTLQQTIEARRHLVMACSQLAAMEMLKGNTAGGAVGGLTFDPSFLSTLQESPGHDKYGTVSSFASVASNASMESTSSYQYNADVVWYPDEMADVCMACRTTRFGVLVRKHHCRMCGRVICWKCSEFVKEGKKEKETRVCGGCARDGQGNGREKEGSEDEEGEEGEWMWNGSWPGTEETAYDHESDVETVKGK
ncbi:hypothetical protein YB2330_000321 [Saitoella coloradoensis]